MELSETLKALSKESRNDPVWYALRNNYARRDGGDFLDFDGTQLSFMPYDKILMYGDNWKSRGRVSGRPIRIAKAVLGADNYDVQGLREADWEQWANRLLADSKVLRGEWEPEFTFDVPFVYNNGPDSCMTGNNPDFYAVYTENNVRMMVAYNTDKTAVLARALVWDKAEVDGIPTTYLDRCYGNEIYSRAFTQYAKAQGWAVYDDWDGLLFQGKKVDRKHLRVKLDKLDQSVMPSIDSFGAHWQGWVYCYNGGPVPYADMLTNKGLVPTVMDCPMCERWTSKNDSHDYFGATICKDCAKTANWSCVDCQKLLTDRDKHMETSYDNYWCQFGPARCRSCYDAEQIRRRAETAAKRFQQVLENEDWYEVRYYVHHNFIEYREWRKRNPDYVFPDHANVGEPYQRAA